MKYEFYLGSYASSEQESVYRYELDTETAILRRKDARKGIENPSYVVLHPKEDRMYCVEERNPQGRIMTFLENVEEKAVVLSEGADPCHLSFDKSGEYLFVSNYTSGSLSVFRLETQSGTMLLVEHKQHTGIGKHPERQEGPHVHFSNLIGDRLYVCDLGLDCLFSYQFDRVSGKLTETDENVRFPDGFGPRHFAFHPENPEVLYVIGELTGEVAVLKKIGETYEIVQRISSLPEKYPRENTAAAIKCSADGKFVFVSNRGNDSITSFRVNSEGKLEWGAICSSGGEGPRDFEIFDEMIVAANQYSNNLAVLKYDKETGKMELVTSEEKVEKPVMVCKL